MTEKTNAVDVIIIGAGPVGLSLAIELGHRGHSVRIVEEADRVGRQPRAKTTNVRSMEHMRRWGLAERIRTASPLPADYANRIVFATGMSGKVITQFENSFNADKVRDQRFAEPAQWIPQYVIEEILRDEVLSLPNCRLEFTRSLNRFEEDATGVTAMIRQVTTGAEEKIRAQYLVGADGARSSVRKQLDIPMEGDGRLANFLTLVLKIPDLSISHSLPEALMYWLINPASPSVIGPMDKNDTWFWGTQLPPDAPLDEASVKARVARSLGNDVSFDILVTDVWAARRLQAKSYGTSRVFLAGDACHLHPPFGGYGMNLGIADAVDLGWKLSATLSGWAGTGMLPSYEVERAPVHRRVIDEAVENMATLSQHFINPHLADDGADGDVVRVAAAVAIQDAKGREFNSLGLVIGYDYRSSPLLVPDNRPLHAPTVEDYQPSAHPGARAPHFWLEDGSSLFDHFGKDFTLLFKSSADSIQVDALAAAAAAVGMPLKLLTLSDPGVSQLYDTEMTLIRPDQHVAWRGDRTDKAAQIVNITRGADAAQL